MTNPVFFADPGELDDVAAGSAFRLAGAEARHAVSVRRLAAGEAADIVDGAGRRVTGTVRSAAGTELVLDVEAVLDEAAPPYRLVLVQALAKGDRDELAVEAATELGVDEVVPWQAERSIVRWRAEKQAKGVAKWESTVRSAAKQSRRARIPAVGAPVDLKGLCALIGRSALALILHEEAEQPLVSAAAALGADAPGQEAAEGTVVMIVGPEGGMSPREVEAMLEAGAQAVRLGPHVLRSSTAGPAAVALLSVQLGRWT
ncbi:16S rRNA (uracil(1498)-N(3))-methyltransferase [Arthrobacter sp. I2-34]|uniref:Ribosomal RNA small subunit methyltransferase E n=1 Tax=Arthrobacter hankyongi TaxID=2904801 RepID=A0ABS9L6C2_9MICC|nr:16S rRNA (uracil(1498)-N(3))-methyltransferase [Arthrobacter hankyongi]MCG2622230.1 16S rRNA (uracil(1498)-N(3))-methyltransferase [Arthrobacter hankyongi]